MRPDLCPRAGRVSGGSAGKRERCRSPALRGAKRPRPGRAGLRPQALCSRGRGGPSPLLLRQPDDGPRAAAKAAAAAAAAAAGRGTPDCPFAPRLPPTACHGPPPPPSSRQFTTRRLPPHLGAPPRPGHSCSPAPSPRRQQREGAEWAPSGGARPLPGLGGRRERAPPARVPGGGGRAAERGRARTVCEGASEGRAIPGRRKAAAVASLGSGQASGDRRCRAGRRSGHRRRLVAFFLLAPPRCPSPFLPTALWGRLLSAARSRGVSAAPVPAAAEGRAGSSPPQPGLRDPPLRSRLRPSPGLGRESPAPAPAWLLGGGLGEDVGRRRRQPGGGAAQSRRHH